MNKEFEAYYSKSFSLIYLGVFAVLTGLNVYLNLSEKIGIPMTVILSLMAVVSLYQFVISVAKNGVAIEIIDDTLIVHTSKTEIIPLTEIKAFYVNQGFGSLDIRFQLTNGSRRRFTCFVKDDKLKKKELKALIDSKGIDTDNFYFD